MTNCQPCKSAGTPKVCRNLTRCYLLILAPFGPELVLLTILEALLWIA